MSQKHFSVPPLNGSRAGTRIRMTGRRIIISVFACVFNWTQIRHPPSAIRSLKRRTPPFTKPRGTKPGLPPDFTPWRKWIAVAMIGQARWSI